MEYSITSYGRMIADSVRMDAYADALERTVRTGSVVLDIGTGPGLSALLAARHGARRVIAVERDDVVETAREMAASNGLADRIEFVQGLSTDLKLDEQADVIVSDLHGVLPFYGGHIDAIIDARHRLLAPGGVLIPLRDTLWVALVEASDAYRDNVDCWHAYDRGFDLGAARELAVNNWWKERVSAAQLLSEETPVKVLDYRTIDDHDLETTSRLTVKRQGTAHGLCVWFSSELTEGEGFSNAPGEPEAIYGTAFFPLPSPVDVVEGDVADVRLDASYLGGDYTWRWDTEFTRNAVSLARFRQSNALGLPLPRSLLERSSETFVPTLDQRGQAIRCVLDLMDGTLGLGEIAARLAAELPTSAYGGDSLRFVVGLAQKHSRA